jgi:transcriptional regulator with XRE-family HTH domain
MALPSEPPGALAKLGRQILRLRLYFGWSQAELGRRAKLSQGTISRLERGRQRGLSIRRLAAVIDALHVADVTFERPPTVPQTELEIMLFGDRWKLAVEGADRRLRWPEPAVDEAADGGEVWEDGFHESEPTAWFEGGG